jgi:flavin-dependent dehydrogenase
MLPICAATTDVFIAGGGPAGLAAAILAARSGFRVLVADQARPPVDKACGEGLMPNTVVSLRKLGVELDAGDAVPFHGIRFLSDRNVVQAGFHQGFGAGIRRTLLHERMLQRAAEAGVSFAWGARVSAADNGEISCNGRRINARWIIGADGRNSGVRTCLSRRPPCRDQVRFGSRRHFRLAPWTNFVEVYWGRDCQVTVTPTACDEICVAVVSRSPQTRVREALCQFPGLARRLAGAHPASSERGAVSGLRCLPIVQRGRFALIGDASGSVDPLTGEGLGLAFCQAEALVVALRDDDPLRYRRAHLRLARVPCLISRLLLRMDKSSWFRRRALSALEAEPHLFGQLLNVHAQGLPASAFGVRRALRLGWCFVAPHSGGNSNR